MNIDLNEFGVRIEQTRTAQGHPVVDSFTQDQHDIGFGESLVDRFVERAVGVSHVGGEVVPDHAPRHGDAVEGKLGACEELLQFPRGIGPPQSAAPNDDGAFGSLQQIEGLNNFVAGGRELRPGTQFGHGQSGIGIGFKQVDGNGEMTGSHAPVDSFLVGPAEVEGYLCGARRLPGPLAHRRGHPDLVDHLEHLPSGERGGGRAAHRNQRAGGLKSGGDAGEGVGMAGTAGDQRYRRAPVDPAVGVRGVRDPRLMPEVDDPDAPLSGGRQHLVEVVSNQGVNLMDSKALDCVDEQFGSGGHSDDRNAEKTGRVNNE